MNGFSEWRKADIERSLRRMKEKIRVSGLPMTIEAINIEEHVAAGLWDEGVITREHFQNSTSKGRGISLQLELEGESFDVRIRTSTYYGSYEFVVTGHPEGYEVARDIPDALALVSNEPVF